MKEGTYASMVRIQTRTANKRESIPPSTYHSKISNVNTPTRSMQGLFPHKGRKYEKSVNDTSHSKTPYIQCFLVVDIKL